MSVTRRTTSRSGRSSWLWPLGLIIIGLLLLLSNFLLLGDFHIGTLWPLLLVGAGAIVLLRGDIVPGAAGRTFGITRGSVLSSNLTINSGEIDVSIRALQDGSGNQDRLIAGQYASQSRPQLRVTETHAELAMLRSRTPWPSFADWEMGLAQRLPWCLSISTSLGQVQVDATDLIIQGASINTGLGHIRLDTPAEAFEPITLRSTLGNIVVHTPAEHAAHITVQKGPFLTIHADEGRYIREDEQTFIAQGTMLDAPVVTIRIQGLFGDVFLT